MLGVVAAQMLLQNGISPRCVEFGVQDPFQVVSLGETEGFSKVRFMENPGFSKGGFLKNVLDCTHFCRFFQFAGSGGLAQPMQ